MTEDTEPLRTANAYRTALELVGLSIVEAGRFFTVDERTARRWANGTLGPPVSVMLCLMLMLHFKLTVADIEDMMLSELGKGG
jgi:hypothetical protein